MKLSWELLGYSTNFSELYKNWRYWQTWSV